MSTEVTLPALGESVTEGTVTRWLKQVGDTVEVGQVLGIVEVMKLMNNIEAKTAGTVTEILAENEDAVEHGQTLMIIEPK